MVVWTQAPCGIYVDLRLPAGAPGRRGGTTRRPEALLARSGSGNSECASDEERAILMQQKSFAGRLHYSSGDTTDGRALREDGALANLAQQSESVLPLCTCYWERDIDYQPPTGGLDVGVCATGPMNADGTLDMRETGDDAGYAEGWRRMVGTSDGPFVALELVSEDGKDGCRSGYWVRTGNRFAYAVGRPNDEESSVMLGCHPQSGKVKQCVGMSLSEALDSLTADNEVGKLEAIDIASTYVAVVGEVDSNGSWHVLASNLANLVGCDLVCGGNEASLCCSSLCVACNDAEVDVGEGALVDQKIVNGSGGHVVRRWRLVELSSPEAFPLSGHSK